MRERFYVVTAPDSARGIYETWVECKAQVDGVQGARYQRVDNRKKAEALLGDGIVLPPGTYAFTDGNALGGVGVVIVIKDMEESVLPKEVSTSVTRVFSGQGIDGLTTVAEVQSALARLHNILAELAGLYHALRYVPSDHPITIVHDYKGVAAWMEGSWKTKDPITKAVIEACRHEVDARDLMVTYRHQRGHQSTWAGRDDFAYWNGRADALATRGSPKPVGDRR
jgi:ribonuclease H-related protein